MKQKSSSLLVLSPYPLEGASVRFRVLQFLPDLEEKGIKTVFHPFMDRKLFVIRRKFGLKNQILKALLFFKACAKLCQRLLTVHKYDVCLIHREIFPFGPPFIERYLKYKGVKIIFDYDDDLSAEPPTGINQRFFQDKLKLEKTFTLSDLVIAGNLFLAEKAAKKTSAGSHTVVIPTVVDTCLFRPVSDNIIDKRTVKIGWVGNWGNAVYLEKLAGVFETLGKKHNICVKLVGGPDIFETSFDCPMERKLWKLDSEIEDIQDFDIGIMPLLGGKYDAGKCGFKIIQYFSIGIPAVATPVGINSQIIDEGKNGFLADNPDDWEKYLELLIMNPEMRKGMGLDGRELVIRRYSKASASALFIDEISKLIDIR